MACPKCGTSLVAPAEASSDSTAETMTTQPAAQAAARELLEDERRFIDLARSPLFVAEEKPVV